MRLVELKHVAAGRQALAENASAIPALSPHISLVGRHRRT